MNTETIAHPCFLETWHSLGNGLVVCNLCPFNCQIKEGSSGVCRVRSNEDGALVLCNYGKTLVPKIDSIRKRPIYLYSNDESELTSLSVGSTGCNNRCPFCQNWEISQKKDYAGLREYSPLDIVREALAHNVKFISFSFNEMIVIYEYFIDVAKKAREAGIKICAKTAGYINVEHMDRFLNHIDVMNLDIKPYSPLEDQGVSYMERCGILNPTVVVKLLAKAIRAGVHTEISHILIEGVNDNEDSMMLFATMIKSIDPEMGIHLLRHYPAWKSNSPVTTDETLCKWGKWCQDFGLKNVFWEDV